MGTAARPSEMAEMAETADTVAGTIAALLRDLRRTWLQLAVTDVLARCAAFVLLVPLPPLLLRLFLLPREGAVLTDEEILFFFLSPLGLSFLVCAGAVSAGLLYAKLASLMAIACGARGGLRLTYADALRHAARHAWSLTQLAGHMTVRVLLVAAPFLAAGGLVYARLLTEHDINYYLTRRPAAFREALAWLGALSLPLAILLARLAVGWFFALPAVLFDDARPRDALRQSRAATRGHGRAIALWLAAWALLAPALSVLVTAGVGLVGRVLIPTESLSLPLVVAAIGAVLATNALANLVVSFLAAALFSLLTVRLYDRWAPSSRPRWAGLAASGSLDDPAPRLPRRGRLGAALALAVAVVGLATRALHDVASGDDVDVAAHRGASGAAPENTLAAFERAIVDGADWVELDVQESADGVIVVAHDRDFMKVSNVAAKVWESPWDELATIDIGSWFSTEFGDQTVATLEQALALCKDRAGVLVELKHYGHARRLEERVIELVEAAGMAADVRIMSLDYASVLRAKRLRPGWTYGLLVAAAMGDLTRLDVDFLAVNAPLATRRLVRSAHRRGKEVFVWTVNDPAQMSALISRGVDGLVTDEPALARSVLARRAEMSAVERLILDVGVRLGLVDAGEEASGAADA